MNLGVVGIRAFSMGIMLYLLSLAGAIAFPLLPIIAGVATGGLLSVLLFILILLLIALIGTLIGKGIRTFKKPIEIILLTYVGAFAMGGLIGFPGQVGLPSIANIHPNWFGGTWYSIPLALLLIGAPIILLFVVGD
jgi:hypothetical protein